MLQTKISNGNVENTKLRLGSPWHGPFFDTSPPWASAGGVGKTGLSPLEIGTKEAKISRKREISILILISWVNSCNNSLFADMTLTQQKSQVHCSGRLTCSDELAVH